jgi:cation diffusion facilitator family transporter
MPTPREGVRAACTGVVINASLATIKIITGIFGHSQALIADGIESLTDIASSLVVLGGLHLSSRPADHRHPYGHGKAEPLAGIVVSLLLLGAAGWIAWQSLHEIRNPHEPPAWFTLPVLALVILIKTLLARRVLSVGHHLGSTALEGDAWHHRSDALTSGAAFVGITVALLAGPQFAAADDWAALLACSIIVFNGVRLLQRCTDELMDASPSDTFVSQVRELAAHVDGVRAIEKCRIRKSGLEWTMDIHVVVHGDLSVRQGHIIAHEVKDRLLTAHLRIVDVTVHIEPHDATHAPQRLPLSSEP